METMNNEVITNEAEVVSESTELVPVTQDDEDVSVNGPTAAGYGIMAGLAIIGWEFVIKPIGKKGFALGKTCYHKLKEKASAKFEKKTDDSDEIIAVEDK